jgi:endo-1,4-beta-xylanase
MNRRRLLASLAATAVAGGAKAQGAPDLGTMGARVGIGFGSAFDREILTDHAYAGLLVTECRIATVENALKFDWLRPRGPTADFGTADRLVAFAARHRLGLKGTALVWNDHPPAWLRGLSAREIGATMDRHIEEVVGRYRGRVAAWDVVNEPFYPPQRHAGGYRMGPWFQAMGKDFVPRAFRRAAAADPRARLVLNEAFCEQNDPLGTSVRPRLLQLVDELKQAGVPLHAVGLQAHLKPHLPYDDAAFAAYVAELAARGVEVDITELDVDDSGLPDDPAERDRRVAARCRDFLTAVLAVPQVTSVITWHLADRYSWYRHVPWYAEQVRRAGGDPRRTPRTHLYDDAMAPKAARAGVAEALRSRPALRR